MCLASLALLRQYPLLPAPYACIAKEGNAGSGENATATGMFDYVFLAFLPA
jgi:hypothetical protein